MKISITGATGFVGSHLVKSLKMLGHEVVALFCDVCDKSDLLKLLSDGNYDIIFHLASAIPKRKKIDEQTQLTMYSTNVIGTENVLNCAWKLNTRMVYLSSLAVCSGGDWHHPVTEDEAVPGDYYSQTKLMGEVLAEHYRRHFEFSIISVRLASVYGPGDRHKFVIPYFLDRVFSGEDIFIHGKGERIMDFIYIDDVVDGIIKAGLSDKVGVFNIGSGKGTTIAELGRTVVEVAQECGFNTKLTHSNLNNAREDTSFLAGDITKAKKILNFTPKVPLAEGIKKCMNLNGLIEE